MLDFYYDFIKEKYPGEKSELLFTDTDSLMIAIESDDIYADMWRYHEHFDLSNYADDHPIFRNDSPETIKWLKQKNKKRVGKFKDEAGGELILKFVGRFVERRPTPFSRKHSAWRKTCSTLSKAKN